MAPSNIFGAYLVLAACTNIEDDNGETTLRCIDSAEIQVNRVIDGDTLDTAQGRVRLFGVDTPERGERCASEATERLQAFVGDSVWLEDGPRLRDRTPVAFGE